MSQPIAITFQLLEVSSEAQRSEPQIPLGTVYWSFCMWNTHEYYAQ